MSKNKRNYSFFIATEQHAKYAIPLIKRLMRYYRSAQVTIYISQSGARIHLIKHEFDKYGVWNYVKRKDYKKLFADILTKSNTIFYLYLAWGPKRIHPIYRSIPGYDEVRNMSLKDIPSTIVLSNEDIYFLAADYVPQAHVILAQTDFEAQILTGQIKDSLTKVVVVGNAWLDFLPEVSYKQGNNLGIAFAVDKSRENTQDVIAAIEAHLVEFISKGHSFKKVFLKGHPGDVRSDHINRFVKFCKKHNWPVEVLDKNCSLENLSNHIHMAIVQSSLSTHLTFRRLGIESFLWCSKKEMNSYYKFIEVSQMPLCKLNHKLIGRYHRDVYDNWIKNTFKLDKNVVTRIIKATK